jgi:hypothetical protein
MFSPVSGLIIRRLGRKNLILCVAVLLNVGVLLFSSVVFMSESDLLSSSFNIDSFLARILMGMGGASLSLVWQTQALRCCRTYTLVRSRSKQLTNTVADRHIELQSQQREDPKASEEEPVDSFEI